MRRVILNAASFASVPEFVKNTRDPSGASASASRRSASAICVGVPKKFDTCPSVPSWAETAAVSVGWAWPSALTAMPASRSRYRFPSASHTYAPSPRTRTRCGGPNVSMTAWA
ncbi:Uncharacterised protein [Mycobacteroides abscessus]|nr:Uncharacterised protein [Mycobacteroides abscessus]